MRNVSLLALLTLVALAAGCATEPARPGARNPDTVTRSINLSGYPPEFRRGFEDGCAAAREQRPRTKAEGQYGVGWNDGFDYCSPKPK